jgi:hypothetical protein
MLLINLMNHILYSASVFVKFYSTTTLATTQLIESNTFKKNLKKQQQKLSVGQELLSISGKQIFDHYSFFRTYELNSLSGLKSLFKKYTSEYQDLYKLSRENNPDSLEDVGELEAHLFNYINPLLTSSEVDNIINYFSEEYFYFQEELDFVIRYDIYNKSTKKELTAPQKKMIYSYHVHFSKFLNNFKAFFFAPIARKILGLQYVCKPSVYMESNQYELKLLFAYIISYIQKHFQSKNYNEMEVYPIEQWDLVGVLRNSLYQYAFHCCWKDYAKYHNLPDVSLPVYFEVMDRKADFLRHRVSCSKTLEASASLDTLAEKYILGMLTWTGQLATLATTKRQMTSDGDFISVVSYHVKPMAVHLSLGVKLPYLRQPSSFMVGEELPYLSLKTKKVIEILHSTSFFIDPIFIDVVFDILKEDQGKIVYSEKAKVNSVDALKKHSIFIEIQEALAILKRMLSVTWVPKAGTSSGKFNKQQRLTIAKESRITGSWEYFNVYSQRYFYNLNKKDWEFVLETRKKLNSFSQAEEKTDTGHLLWLFSRILDGYKLFFRYTLDWRLRIYSGTVLFSKDSGLFKFSVCGPILALTQVGFLALFKCYFSYGDNPKENFSRIEKCFAENTLSSKKKILLVKKCFDSLKYVKLNSPNYLRSQFLENTVTAALNTAKTGFLMPLDQKNSVWMFVGLFFRNKKILSLTSIIENKYKMDLIQYLQSEDEGFIKIVLQTRKKSKFFKENDLATNELVANSIRKFIKLFSEKRSFHKSLSMFSVFGQGAFGRRNELEKLVQNELGDNENLMKEDLEALKRIAGGYNEFLNEYLDGIATHINSFEQLSKQYFKFKFLSVESQIKRINIKLKRPFYSDEFAELELRLKELEQDQALYFKNVNGDLIYHQETSWLESSRNRQSMYSHSENVTKKSDTRKYGKKINADSRKIAHQMRSSVVHSMEAAVLHDVILKLDEKGIRINHCHDCYQIHPNFYTIFFEVMSDVYGKQFGSASTFWDLSTILVNREGIYWLEDPVLSSEQRLELEKMMANFMKSFSFTMDSSWTFKNVKECYVFDR